MINLPLHFIGLEGLFLPSSAIEAVGLILFVLLAAWGFRMELGTVAGLVIAGCGVISFLVIGSLTTSAAIAAVALGALAWVRSGRSLIPRRRAEFLREISLVLGGYVLYELARLNTQADFPLARDNAHRVVEFERAVGLFFERQFQAPFIESANSLRIFGFIYSHTFLTITIAAILWLYLVDDRNYRLLRNSLGISAALAATTIALFPVAPPRLLPEHGIVDTLSYLGHEYTFANEYAAVPSLHVGWMMVAGFAVGRSIGGRLGWMVMPIPGVVMAVTVIVTGNHWSVDGLVGTVFTMLPAAIMLGMPPAGTLRRLGDRLRVTRRGIAPTAARSYQVLSRNSRAKFSILALSALIVYMLVARAIDAGFTDYWGYLVFQMAVSLLFLLAGEAIFAEQGGLSWQTHALAVVCSYADTLGTDGNLYARIDEYDKLTHFIGVAAVTAGAYDVFRALDRRGSRTWFANDRLVAAVAVGMALGVAWEGWEFVGDKVFQTSRIGGIWDTTNDLFSDAAGALTAGLILWRQELGAAREALRQPERRSST